MGFASNSTDDPKFLEQKDGEVLINYYDQQTWCSIALEGEEYYLVKFERPTGYYVLRFSSSWEFQTYFFITVLPGEKESEP